MHWASAETAPFNAPSTTEGLFARAENDAGRLESIRVARSTRGMDDRTGRLPVVRKRALPWLMAALAAGACSSEHAGVGSAGSAHDPLGTAQAAPATCPGGGLAGTCQALTVSCPGIADFTATIKVVSPSAASAGTIIFQNGG